MTNRANQPVQIKILDLPGKLVAESSGSCNPVSENLVVWDDPMVLGSLTDGAYLGVVYSNKVYLGMVKLFK